jgi:hypothetical protein
MWIRDTRRGMSSSQWRKSWQQNRSMSNQRGPEGEAGQPMIYQIRIKGHLGRQWAYRFEELSITLEDDGTTLLTGPVVDQAALHGIMKTIRDLGITLLSVNSIDGSPPDPPEGKRRS